VNARRSRKKNKNVDVAGSCNEQSLAEDRVIFGGLGLMSNGNLEAAAVLNTTRGCGLPADDVRLRTSFAELMSNVIR
jgi:hypothetical protein